MEHQSSDIQSCAAMSISGGIKPLVAMLRHIRYVQWMFIESYYASVSFISPDLALTLQAPFL